MCSTICPCNKNGKGYEVYMNYPESVYNEFGRAKDLIHQIKKPLNKLMIWNTGTVFDNIVYGPFDSLFDCYKFHNEHMNDSLFKPIYDTLGFTNVLTDK